MYNVWHYRRAYKKLSPKWFGPFVIKKVFANHRSYELENVDGSPFLDHINHDKLKKCFGYVIPNKKSIMNLKVM
jgi:hypothetical protein